MDIENREQLLSKIDESFDIMKKIYKCEFSIYLYMDSLMRSKLPGGYVFLFFFCMIVTVIIGRALNSIPVFGLLVSVILTIITFVLPIKLRITSPKKWENKIIQSRQELIQLKNDPVLSWLPMPYRDANAYAYIDNYVRNLNGDDLQGAIDSLEMKKQLTTFDEIYHHSGFNALYDKYKELGEFYEK